MKVVQGVETSGAGPIAVIVEVLGVLGIAMIIAGKVRRKWQEPGKVRQKWQEWRRGEMMVGSAVSCTWLTVVRMI
jgi:threonine/homoserine/homoserine lactone efflux protein